MATQMADGRESVGRAGLVPFSQLKLWAALVGCGMALCGTKENMRHYRPVMSFMTLMVLLILWAATKKRVNILRALVLAFSFLHVGAKLQMAYVKKAPCSVYGYMDLLTELMSTLPELLMLDLPAGPLALLLLCHAASNACRYHLMAAHGIPVAILRALAVQAVCYYAFVRLRGSISRASLTTKQPGTDEGKEAHLRPQQVLAAEVGRCKGGLPEAAQPSSSDRCEEQQASPCKPLSAAAPAPLPDPAAVEDSGAGAAMQARGGGSSACAGAQSMPPTQAGVQQGVGTRPEQHEALHGLTKPQALPARSPMLADWLPVADPVVQKALGHAFKAAQRTHALQYTSQLRRQGSLQHGTALQCLQRACRIAITVQGQALPENIPEGALTDLQQRFKRVKCRSGGEPAAMRAGCVVISYSTLSCSQGAAGQDVHEVTAAVAKAWAEELGLLADEGCSVSVQACDQLAWSINRHGTQRSLPLPEFSLALRTPFLLVCPSGPGDEATSTAQPPPAAPAREGVPCSFEVALIAPPPFDEVRGWQGAADAPEDLPADVMGRCLCVLASVGGQHVRVAVDPQSGGGDTDEGGGARTLQVQVQVSLPASMLDASASCPTPLVLELWAAGTLVGSHSAMLMTSDCAAACSELRGLVDGPAATNSAAFLEDLLHWMQFQAEAAAACGANQQQQQQEQPQQLEQMAGVGKALLEHSAACGLAAVAGMLARGLAAAHATPTLPVLRELQLPGARPCPLANPSPLAPPLADGLRHKAAALDAPAPAHSRATLGAAAARPPAAAAAAAAAPATLWAAATRACVMGFGEASEAGSGASAWLQQTGQPTEAGYQQWGAAFTQQLHSTRFWTALCTVPSAIKSLLFGDRVKSLCAIANLMPFFMFANNPKVGVQVLKWCHLFSWTLMGLGFYAPADNQLRTMVNLNLEVLVLAFFHSKSLCQVRLRTLLCDRVATIVVLALLFMRLATWRPLLRSLLINSAALLIECCLDIFLRYLYLRHVEVQDKKKR